MAFGSDALSVALKITADASQAENEIKKFRGELGDIDKSSGSAVSGLGTLTSAITGATAVLSIASTAALATGAALFKLAQTSADFGSAIFDAGQKTGLSAETLSSLKFAADQSGSSLEAMTGATAKFAKVVGDAADGSAEAAKKLSKFGIEPQEAINDLDGALDKVFKTIIEARPGVEQLTLAQAAFGKSGADLIPTIKSFDGDMVKLRQTTKDLGLSLTDEAARAADEFGDQLDTLNAQLAGISRTVGNEVIPVFSELASDLSNFFSKNKDEVETWGIATGVALNNFQRNLRSIAGLVSSDSVLSRLFGLTPFGFAVNKVIDHFGDQVQKVKDQRDRDRAGAFDFSSLTPEERKALQPLGPKRVSGSDTESTKKSAKVVTDSFDKQFRDYAKDVGFQVSRVKGGAVNTGSLHPTGQAGDLRIGGKSNEDIVKALAEGISRGFRVIDERFVGAIPGVKSTGPNIHAERPGSTKSSLFVPNRPDLYDGQENLDFLKNLDAKRRNKGTGGFAEFRQKTIEDTTKLEEQLAEIRIKYADDTAKREYEIGQKSTNFLIAEAERLGEAYEKANNFDGAKEQLEEQSRLRLQLIQNEIDELQRLAVEKEKAAKDAQSAVGGEKDPKKKIQLQIDATKALNEAGEARHKVDQKTIELQTAEAESAVKLGAAIKELTADQIAYNQAKIEGQEASDAALADFDAAVAEEEAAAAFAKIAAAAKAQDDENLANDPFYYWKKSFGEFMEQLQAGTGIMDTAFGTVQGTLGEMADLLAASFDNVARAIGQTVAQYVLYGKTAPAVLRTILAATLAQIAAEATYQAIKAAAIGFILLATGDFGGAANAFISAGMWGLLAAGAAIAGRAIAPKQDAQKSVGKATSGGGGTGASEKRDTSAQGQAFSSKKEATIEDGISRARDLQKYELTVRVESRDSHILGVVRNDISNNGETRDLIIKTAEG